MGQQRYRGLNVLKLLNRNSPFGLEVLSAANELPEYTVLISRVELRSSGGKGPVEIELEIQCGLAAVKPASSKAKRKQKSYDMTAVLTLTSDMTFIDFRRIP